MMIKYFISILLFFSSPLYSEEFLFLSSGEAIEVKLIDKSTGKLKDYEKVDFPKLSVFTFSRNKKFLYALASIKNDPKQVSILTYKVSKNGQLNFIHNAPVNVRTTELKTDHTDNFIALASYGEGTVTICQLENGIYKGKIIQEVQLEKKAHATRFSPDNRMLMVPATGPNLIFQLTFDEKTGKITQKKSALSTSKGACQPRHLIFHPKLNVAYSTQERMNPGVGVWNWDSKKGELNFIQDIVYSSDPSKKLTTADLHLSPDNKFLYASIRDRNKELDGILLYEINKNGSLNYLNRFDCENFPRSFCINKTGDYIYVAGQRANMLGVYKIDKSTGFLNKVIQYETGLNPIWVETFSITTP